VPHPKGLFLETQHPDSVASCQQLHRPNYDSFRMRRVTCWILLRSSARPCRDDIVQQTRRTEAALTSQIEDLEAELRRERLRRHSSAATAVDLSLPPPLIHGGQQPPQPRLPTPPPPPAPP